MYMSDRVRAAACFSYKMHHGQVDKSGMPYIFHPYRVADRMERYRRVADVESLTIVALLHDVVEDVEEMTIDGLKNTVLKDGWRLTKDEVRWIDAVTRRKDETYDNYITRTMAELASRVVKFEDVKDHLECPLICKQMQLSLIQRYEKAYNRLRGV